MPLIWQITEARALQTQGVWALFPTLTVGGSSKISHASQLLAVQMQATTTETSKNNLDTADGVLRTEYDYFQSFNVAIAARLDSEVADGDPLQNEVDQIRKQPENRAAIDERTLKTIALWKKINLIRITGPPLQSPIIVRGNLANIYEARWAALPAKRQTREDRAGTWRSSSSSLRAADRALDRINKSWYQAWASEFQPGTPEGDALAGVDTEAGTAQPQILEIAAITQVGLSLRVTYVPATGKHATVLQLDHLVEGLHGDFQTTPATVASGNLLGPFTQGQIVRIRTDVGNSRDHSELSPEQAVTIGPAV